MPQPRSTPARGTLPGAGDSDGLTASQPGGTMVYVALGANLGDRARALRTACQELATTPGLRVLARSLVYESAAITPDPQPTYLNAIVRAVTTLSPQGLLARCLEIERALGRVRRPDHRMEARPLDLDIVLYGDQVISLPGLVVPHPRMLERSFVRVPLAEVALPGLLHPTTHDRLDVTPPRHDLHHFGELW